MRYIYLLEILNKFVSEFVLLISWFSWSEIFEKFSPLIACPPEGTEQGPERKGKKKVLQWRWLSPSTCSRVTNKRSEPVCLLLLVESHLLTSLTGLMRKQQYFTITTQCVSWRAGCYVSVRCSIGQHSYLHQKLKDSLENYWFNSVCHCP